MTRICQHCGAEIDANIFDNPVKRCKPEVGLVVKEEEAEDEST